MPSVRFIHTADLHLDSPFKGLSAWNADLAEKLKDATLRSFRNIIDLCIERKVDFLVISGDIFDSEDKSLTAQLRFVSEIKRLSGHGIATYFVCGNHDPSNEWLNSISLPENAYRFDSSEVQHYTFKKGEEAIADIHGISFRNKVVRENLAEGFKLTPNPAPINIAVLHGTVGLPGPHENYAPFNPADVISKGFDYWAMGHIHKNCVIRNSHPAIIYPGNPQGRDFGETGEKGCYLVDIQNGKIPVAEFIPVKIIRFEDIEIEMAGTDKIDLLQGRIDEALKLVNNYDENGSYILRITFKGRTPLHSVLNSPGQIEGFVNLCNEEQRAGKGFVWIDRIIVRTQPDIDIENIRNSTGFTAEILEKFDSCLEDREQLGSLVRSVEKDFLSNQVRKLIPELNEEMKIEILEQAKIILLDKFIPEE